MKRERKKYSTAAVNVASKKGKPTKTYPSNDSVRMMSIRDERRLQSLPWLNAKPRNYFDCDS
jgi:hypothetical protein